MELDIDFNICVTVNRARNVKGIFNEIWKGCGFPGSWRTGLNNSIHKKGDREN